MAESLMARFYEQLYPFNFGLTRDEADSRDLVQQSFCIWGNKLDALTH
jgi:DNA-directed RNA polymerase specialized sigma24 family protein